MKVVNAGYRYTHGYDFFINRPYGSGDYVLLVIKTEAFFVLDGKRILAPKNSVIVYKKGTPQIYGASEKEFINDWLHFELDECEYEWALSLGVPFDKILRVRDSSAFSSLIKSIFYEQYSKNSHSEQTASLYLKIIFLKLAEGLEPAPHNAAGVYYKPLSALRAEIYSSPSKNFSIDSICRQLNLSRSYLQHLYKAIFNTTVIADVTASRIEHAKYLLFSTDIPICEIAEQCGYKSDVHFMRVFKESVGVTPSEYRKEKRILKA